MNHWWYFLLGVIAWPFIRLLALSINRAVIEYRQKKFLKLVSVRFPDKKDITFITLDTSDRRAMAKLEKQLRENFDAPEDEDRRGDRGRDGGSRRPDPPRRKDTAR